MATYDLPAALLPQVASFGLQKAGMQFRSPFNGALQSIDLAAERWMCSITTPPKSHAAAGAAEAYLNLLAGGVNRVRIWHPARPVPAGTLRGSPTLASGASLGASTLSITGALAGVNLLTGSSFELDANANGYGDGWSAYAAGTTGVVTQGLVAPGNASGFLQRINAAGLGTSSADQVGIRTTNLVPVTGGASYTAAIDTKASTALGLVIAIGWYTSGSSFISLSSSTGRTTLASVWSRSSFTATAPSNAAFAWVYYWNHSRATVGAVSCDFDNAQFERSSSASAYAGAPTLLAGDMLRVGAQLFQVAADTALNDAGAGAVPVINRVRTAISSGAAVTWNKPTAEFLCPSMANRVTFRPGYMEGAVIDLEEAY